MNHLSLLPKISGAAVCLGLLLLSPVTEAQASNTAARSNLSATDGSPYHKLRSVSGAAGHEDKGRFVMDDARSVFTTGKDPKVIVYFEWEGPLGHHHFEGLWKSPEGKIVLLSDFSYESKTPRYSGYWTMLLADSSPSGEWNIEARIDGEAAGTHSFIVTGSPIVAAPRSAVPRPLSNSEMYKTAMDAAVMIERLSADGSAFGKSSGFWIDDGVVLTTFSAIDSAKSLRISNRAGSSVTTDQVLAWNRWQDWAILHVAANTPAKLKRGPSDPVSVGDHSVFLEWGAAGAKLADGSITGINSFPTAGERLLVASGATPQSVGGALLNEFGDYVGMIVGDTAPGGGTMKILGLMNATPSRTEFIDMETTALAVPLALLPTPDPSAKPTSLSEIAAKGDFLPSLVKSDSIALATLSSYVEKDPDRLPFAKDYRQVFARKDNKASVFVSWPPREKRKVKCEIRLFNLDNKMLSESKERELNMSPGKFMATTWELPVGVMAVGIYRVDLLLGGETVWRDFFRIME